MYLTLNKKKYIHIKNTSKSPKVNGQQVNAYNESKISEFFRINYYQFVPKIYKVDNNLIYMEKIDAPDLQEFISMYPEKKDRVYKRVDLIIDILESSPIIHRDLNHLNFLIEEKGCDIIVWLIDFGFSKIKNNLEESNYDRNIWEKRKKVWKPLPIEFILGNGYYKINQ